MLQKRPGLAIVFRRPFSKRMRNKPLHSGSRGDKPLREASTWHLQAPALDATIGVTFGEAVVSPDAARQPRVEILGVKNGRTVIHLPAVSAALVFLE